MDKTRINIWHPFPDGDFHHISQLHSDDGIKYYTDGVLVKEVENKIDSHNVIDNVKVLNEE